MLNEFSGYILAGGKSSRMGTDKAFLKIGDKTFLENAIDILRPVCETRIKIVLNKNQTNIVEKLPQNLTYIFDIYQNRGVLAGIHSALQDCQTKYAVILAVDLPFVTPDVILKLATSLTDFQECPAIVPEQANHQLQPLCGIYNKNICLRKLESLLEADMDASANKFLELINSKIISFNKLNTASDTFLNVNFDTDYQRIKNS